MEHAAQVPTHHEGAPQPASQSLSQEEAERLVQRTSGQLRAYLAGDGSWYVYDPRFQEPHA